MLHFWVPQLEPSRHFKETFNVTFNQISNPSVMIVKGKCAWYQLSADSVFTPLSLGFNEKGLSSHQETMIGDLCFWFSLEICSNSEENFRTRFLRWCYSSCQRCFLPTPLTWVDDLLVNKAVYDWLTGRRLITLTTLIKTVNETIKMKCMNWRLEEVFAFLFLILISSPQEHISSSADTFYHLFQQVFESAVGEQ